MDPIIFRFSTYTPSDYILLAEARGLVRVGVCVEELTPLIASCRTKNVKVSKELAKAIRHACMEKANGNN
jgi:hypothetical protein